MAAFTVRIIRPKKKNHDAAFSVPLFSICSQPVHSVRNLLFSCECGQVDKPLHFAVQKTHSLFVRARKCDVTRKGYFLSGVTFAEQKQYRWYFSQCSKFRFNYKIIIMANVVPPLGEAAPVFKGTAVVDGEFKDISLEDYKGKYVVLFFYPLDL